MAQIAAAHSASTLFPGFLLSRPYLGIWVTRDQRQPGFLLRGTSVRGESLGTRLTLRLFSTIVVNQSLSGAVSAALIDVTAAFCIKRHQQEEIKLEVTL